MQWDELVRSLIVEDGDLTSNQPFGGIAAIERYLGNRPLSQSLKGAGIQRAVDVGCGYRYDMMKQLARLTHEGVTVFSPDDLLEPISKPPQTN